MGKKWYVLQVSTGKETEAGNLLERQGYKVLVPLTQKLIRRKGSWHKSLDIVFTGYVFIKLNYSWTDYYNICKCRSVIKILGGGYAPVPLSDDEIMNVRRLDILRSISKIKFDADGNIIPLSGILSEFKDCLTSVKRRQKRAVIELEIAGTKARITVPFEETV